MGAAFSVIFYLYSAIHQYYRYGNITIDKRTVIGYSIMILCSISIKVLQWLCSAK